MAQWAKTKKTFLLCMYSLIKHEHLEFYTNLDEVQAAVQGSGPFEQMLLPKKHATHQGQK